jgi:hypothetical protein
MRVGLQVVLQDAHLDIATLLAHEGEDLERAEKWGLGGCRQSSLIRT